MNRKVFIPGAIAPAQEPVAATAISTDPGRGKRKVYVPPGIEPGKGFFGRMGDKLRATGPIGETIANVPGSFYENVIEPFSIPFNKEKREALVGGVKAAGKGFLQSAGQAMVPPSARQSAFGPGSSARPPITPEQEAYHTLGEAQKARYTNIDSTAKADPVGLGLDASAALMTGGKAAGPGRMGNILMDIGRKMDPLRAAGNLAKGTAKAGRHLIREGAARTLGRSTTKGQEFIKATAEAAARGGEDLIELRAARRGQKQAEDVADDIREGFVLIKTSRDTKAGVGFGKLVTENPNVALRLSEIQQDTPALLREFGIGILEEVLPKRSGSAPHTTGDIIRHLDFNPTAGRQFASAVEGDQKLVVRAFQAMTNPRRRNDLEGMQALKTQLRSLNGEAKLFGNTEAAAVIAKMQDKVREELGTIKGYNEWAEAFSDDSTLLAQLQRSFSIQNMTTETLITKLTNLLRDRDNLDMRRRLLGELEQVTGKPIKAQIAGIVARGAGAGPEAGILRAVGKGGALFSAGSGNLLQAVGFLALIPFTNPKRMSQLVDGLVSLDRRGSQAIENIMIEVSRNLKRAGVNTSSLAPGTTVGLALTNAARRGQEPGEAEPREGLARLAPLAETP